MFLTLRANGEAVCDIELIRSLDWIDDYGARAGGRIWLDMQDMGLYGEADVLAIRPIAAFEPGDGRLVTGVFRHTQAEVYDLQLASESSPIGVTGSHPFWSVDRNAWVAAIDLEIGERLKTIDGTTTVESRTRRDDPETVYNIEVEGDHVYRVGESAVLVHNNSANCPDKTTYKSLGRKEVTVSWYSGTIERANGITATIVEGSPEGESFGSSFPDWWDDFIDANPTERGWEKGHLLAKRFGGPAKDYNLAPQHFLVNQSAFKTCENRIAEAMKCGCVRFRVEVNYGAQRRVVPLSFRFKAEGPGIKIDEIIPNVANASAPTQCQK